VEADAYCTKCKKRFSGEVCPVCGEKEATIHLSAPLLHTFIGFMAVGLVTILAFAKIYRPVDSTGVSKWVIVLFLIPTVPHLVIALRGGWPEAVGALRKAYLCCGISLWLVAAALLANGALDSKALEEVRATVTGRRHSTQRSGETYQIEIEAESFGKKKHLLDVNRDLYCVLNPGDTVLVEIHSGELGLPWYGQIRATK
jgi:hypothetical protein